MRGFCFLLEASEQLHFLNFIFDSIFLILTRYCICKSILSFLPLCSVLVYNRCTNANIDRRWVGNRPDIFLSNKHTNRIIIVFYFLLFLVFCEQLHLGVIATKVMILHTSELMKWSLTTGFSLLSYSGYAFFFFLFFFLQEGIAVDAVDIFYALPTVFWNEFYIFECN